MGWVEGEASIVGYTENGIYEEGGIQYAASKVVDGLGLDGMFYDENGCATTEGSGVQWLSLELDSPQIVTKVQIARRMDRIADQGRNVRITVGPSRMYDPAEPLCLPEIPDLKLTSGLMDYVCTELPPDALEGRYVKLSSSTEINLSICEVKVFIRSKGKQFFCWSRGQTRL